MLKIKWILLLMVISTAPLFAQKATLKVTIKNTTAETINVIQPKLRLSRNFLKQGYATLALDDAKSMSQTFAINEPQFIDISCYDNSKKKSLNYSFYISNGDALVFTADFNEEKFDIKVTGKGSNNNQTLLNNNFNFDVNPFLKDSLPTRIMHEINKQYALLRTNFEAYQQKYKPSKELVRDWELKLKYGQLFKYYSFKSERKFNVGAAYYRNISAWNKVQDSLLTTNELNNDMALHIPEYLNLVSRFLLRTKEDLWRESQENSVSFYREYYNVDTASGKRMFLDDRSNGLKEKIINKYFTGKTKAYLYAVLIEEALNESDPKNLAEIFGRFKQQYPENEYVNRFAVYVDNVAKKQQLALNDKMVFAKNDGVGLTSFAEILALVKGKTVLLDMWGTWCGPCREEMEKNGKEIKAYFKNKGLDYLYVANYDMENKSKWKELIPYFDLQGLHVLANQKLTTDIMSKTKGTGFPTYILIKKDGSFELSKAGYPMERSLLFKQIDEALALGK